MAERDKTKLEVADSYANFATGVGTGIDKSAQGMYRRSNFLTRDFSQLDALAQENWVARKLLKIFPLDMTREWMSFTGDLDSNTITKITQLETDWKIKTLFHNGEYQANLYGGALLFIDVEGTGESNTPLVLSSIKKDAKVRFSLIDRTLVSPIDQNNLNDDIFDNFLLPNSYTVDGSAQTKNHHSRVIRFDGELLSKRLYIQNGYWHDSILTSVYDALRDYDQARSTYSAAIPESIIDYVQIVDLLSQFEDDDSQAALEALMRLNKRMKSNLGVTVIDANTNATVVNKDLSHLDKATNTFAEILSSALFIPKTRFLGDSPSGLGATGNSERKDYFETIKGRQESKFSDNLAIIHSIAARVLGLPDGSDLSFEWNSLEIADDKLAADTFKIQVDAYTALVDKDVLTAYQVAQQVQQDGYFTNINQEDLDKLSTVRKDSKKDSENDSESISESVSNEPDTILLLEEE